MFYFCLFKKLLILPKNYQLKPANMKKLFFLLALSFLFSNIYSQNNEPVINNSNPYAPKMLLSLGTGINSHYGLLGFDVNFNVFDKLYLDAALGLGSWGSKVSGGLIYMSQEKTGWSYELSYSYCQGAKGLEMELEVADSAQKISSRKVKMDYLPASTLNFFLAHHWSTKGGSRFNLKFGYAIPIEQKPYKLQSSGYMLTENSETILRAVQPGGLLLALSYSFKLN